MQVVQRDFVFRKCRGIYFSNPQISTLNRNLLCLSVCDHGRRFLHSRQILLGRITFLRACTSLHKLCLRPRPALSTTEEFEYAAVYFYGTLNSLLVRNSEIHNRTTRHSNINLMCPKYERKTEGDRTFLIRTIKTGIAFDSYIAMRFYTIIMIFPCLSFTQIQM